MASLIDNLFAKSEADAIRSLWEDTGSRRIIQKEIGKRLLAHNQIVNELPLTQLMLLSSLSDFADENECNNVAGIIYWGMHRTDIIPMVTEHRGKELAYRCLVSLGIFKKYVIERCNRYGSPAPSFYRKAGIKSFKDVGMEDIGNHFKQWENFLGEFFVLDNKSSNILGE